MTNTKNEQLLNKLTTIALKIDELTIDNEFQNYFAKNKIFKNEVITTNKILWLEIHKLSEEVQKKFIENTYKTIDGSKIDVKKFNEQFNKNN